MRRVSVFVVLASNTVARAGTRSAQPTFRVTTERVVIEFIATATDGNPVTDLTKDEIAVFFEKKPQTVDRLLPPLAGEGGAAAGAAADPSGPLPAALPAREPSPPGPEGVSG